MPGYDIREIKDRLYIRRPTTYLNLKGDFMKQCILLFIFVFTLIGCGGKSDTLGQPCQLYLHSEGTTDAREAACEKYNKEYQKQKQLAQ
ncbi:hypothetical protein LCGC14_0650270 [marine sediment metagenome]|uniref:Uncharacterized protein n=1 Tax=marine sediment metagenome TaxID=412755 RepID=A0A0F9U4W2_9ZZZZ|nr:hypothetical protein [Candidatus Aminicenantes bacterium]